MNRNEVLCCLNALCVKLQVLRCFPEVALSESTPGKALNCTIICLGMGNADQAQFLMCYISLNVFFLL